MKCCIFIQPLKTQYICKTYDLIAIDKIERKNFLPYLKNQYEKDNLANRKMSKRDRNMLFTPEEMQKAIYVDGKRVSTSLQRNAI